MSWSALCARRCAGRTEAPVLEVRSQKPEGRHRDQSSSCRRIEDVPALPSVLRLLSLALAIAVAITACRRQAAGEPVTASIVVTTAMARADTLRDTFSAPGTVVASTAGEQLVVPPG